MISSRLAVPFLALAAASAVLADDNNSSSTDNGRYYEVQDSFVGENFLDGFDFEDFADPTHGRVNYVDECTALENGLVQYDNQTFVMRADNTTVLDPNGPGRDSVRIASKNAYGVGVIVMDLNHMPTGCGTWPAFWTNANNMTWPTGGEIDILEGVNDEGPNGSVLHTASDSVCFMNSTDLVETGQLGSNNCTSSEGNNSGCKITSADQLSYGPNLNSVGGGWFAMERTASFINVWYWPRNATDVPDDIVNGGQNGTTINPAAWGEPYANFVNNNCEDMENYFAPQNIIINLTFCGDWAGAAYPSTCPSTCVDHVNSDPSAFSEAYWDIASLNVYAPAASAGVDADVAVSAKRHNAVRRHHHQHLNRYSF